MKVIFSNQQLLHSPKKILSSGAFANSPESPGRAETLLQSAIASGLDLETPQDYGLSPVAAVHTPQYLTFLENIHARWLRIPGASKDVLPNVHPESRDSLYPASAVGQVGYHVFDGAAPITADTWNSALWSAYSAVQAARELAEATGLDKVPLAQQTAYMRRKGIISARHTSEGLIFTVANPKILQVFPEFCHTGIPYRV